MYLTVSEKICIVHTSMHAYQEKHFLTKQCMSKILWGQYSEKEHCNIPSYSPSNGEFNNFCFVSITQRIRVSRAFVYNAAHLNHCLVFGKTASTHKGATDFIVITLSYMIYQSLINIST